MHETPNSINSTRGRLFIVCDLDRTLLNTELVFNLFRQAFVEEGHIKKGHLREAQSEVEASGGSFDLMSYISTILSPLETERVMSTFRRRVQAHDILNQDARAFIGLLSKHHIDYGILTFGSEQWQREKIKVAGLENIPLVITSRKGKGHLVASWYSEESKRFLVPAAFGANSYEKLIIIDDKASELANLPPHAIGLLYRNGEIIRPSQGGSINNKNTHIIRSLGEAEKYIFNAV